MEWLLDVLKQRSDDDWLIGVDRIQLQQLTTELYLELRQVIQTEKTPKIILAEREPVRFLASFLAGCAVGCPIFLCNPDWGQQEWQQVFDLVQPDIIWGQLLVQKGNFTGLNKKPQRTQRKVRSWEATLVRRFPPLREVAWFPPGATFQEREHREREEEDNFISWFTIRNYQLPNYIFIPTGGSSGNIKFAIHTWETLMASVRGFREYFKLNQVNSFCVLPVYHVSGLMQFMRSFTSSGKLVITPFKQIESTINWDIEPSDFFISLVPTQLQRLLENPKLSNWLSQFQTVLLGGAPAWQELLNKAKYHQIRLAPTYGMTETASQIATLKPDDFLNGKISSGKILPHANVSICNQKGEILNTNQIGNITITAESLFLGYYNSSFFPNYNHQLPITNYQLPTFSTDDLGFLDSQGYLNIIGRNSNKIITGGENVYPEEVESAIKATKMVTDVCVIGIPDKQWGQAVTAIYIPQNSHSRKLQ